MLPFYFKRIGYFVIILSFVLFLLIALNFFSSLIDVGFEVCRWIGLCGLVLVTISKEENETSETERRRFHCFFRTFFGVLVIVVVFSLSNLFVTDDKVSIEKALGYLRDNDLLKFSLIFLIAHFFAFRKELRKIDLD